MYQIYRLPVANWRCRLHAQQIFLLQKIDAYKFCNMKICHLFRGTLQENIAHITSHLAQMPLSKQRRENTKIIVVRWARMAQMLAPDWSRAIT